MRSGIVEKVCEKIMDDLGLSLQELSDYETLVEFLCHFAIESRDDDELYDECEYLYARKMRNTVENEEDESLGNIDDGYDDYYERDEP